LSRGEVEKNQNVAINIMNFLQKDTIIETQLLEDIKSWVEVDLSQIPE